jgi:hypothetical protein
MLSIVKIRYRFILATLHERKVVKSKQNLFAGINVHSHTTPTTGG